MMQVKFRDLRPREPELVAALQLAFERVMSSGQYVLGVENSNFCTEFAHYVGVNFCLGVGNGFDALQLILLALNVKPKDVAVPDVAPLFTWMAVTRAGGRIYMGDDLPHVQLCVYLYGQAAFPSLPHAYFKGHYWLVEDCAQAHGLRIHGKMAGSFGVASAFSFYPTKSLGCYGDGGAVLTDDASLYSEICDRRKYGDGRYEGINSRLDELQAAFLRAKLPYLERWNARCRDIADRYIDALSGIDLLAVPKVDAAVTPTWHQFVISMRNAHLRDELREYLLQNGIETMIHYPTVCADMPFYKYEVHRTPEASDRATRLISLPMYPYLGDNQVDYVIEKIIAFQK